MIDGNCHSIYQQFCNDVIDSDGSTLHCVSFIINYANESDRILNFDFESDSNSISLINIFFFKYMINAIPTD